MKKTLARLVPFLGRVLIAQIFIFAAINKLTDPAHTIALIAGKGIPFPTFCCYAAATIELVGSLALVLAIRLRWVAPVLAGFVVLVTTIFHWNFAQGMNVHLFRKDLAIAGGLLLAAYFASD